MKIGPKVWFIGALATTLAVLALPGTSTASTVRPSSGDDAGGAESPALDLLRAVRASQGEELDSAEFAHVIGLRAHYGLSTDEAFVRSLYELSAETAVYTSATGIAGFIRFSEEEIDAVLRRAQAEWTGEEIDVYLSESLPRTMYAGSAIVAQSVVVFCDACDQETVLRGVRSTVRHSEIEVRVEQVDFSLVELDSAAQSIARELSEEGTPYGLFIDLLNNEVAIQADVSADSINSADQAVIRLEPYVEGVDDVNKDEFIIYGLVEAGQAISLAPSNTPTCTSAFAVSGAFGNFILTAGHCVQNNQVWRQGGATLGTVAARRNGGPVDVGLISTSGVRVNWGRVHSTSTGWNLEVTFPMNSNQVIFQTVCQTGFSTTGLSGDMNASGRCAVVTSTSFTPPSVPDPGDPFQAAFARTSYMRAGGDSGAAVIWPTIYGQGAAGLHKGASGGDTYFTRYQAAADLYGLTLSPW